MLVSIVNACNGWDRIITLWNFTLQPRDIFNRFMYWVSWSGAGALYFIFAAMVLLAAPGVAEEFLPACAIAFIFEVTSHKALKHIGLVFI